MNLSWVSVIAPDFQGNYLAVNKLACEEKIRFNICICILLISNILLGSYINIFQNPIMKIFSFNFNFTVVAFTPYNLPIQESIIHTTHDDFHT